MKKPKCKRCGGTGTIRECDCGGLHEGACPDCQPEAQMEQMTAYTGKETNPVFDEAALNILCPYPSKGERIKPKCTCHLFHDKEDPYDRCYAHVPEAQMEQKECEHKWIVLDEIVQCCKCQIPKPAPQPTDVLIDFMQDKKWQYYWGSMFECGDFEQLIDDIRQLLAEQRDKTIEECVARLRDELPNTPFVREQEVVYADIETLQLLKSQDHD